MEKTNGATFTAVLNAEIGVWEQKLAHISSVMASFGQHICAQSPNAVAFSLTADKAVCTNGLLDAQGGARRGRRCYSDRGTWMARRGRGRSSARCT